jgi:hypothetical protein
MEKTLVYCDQCGTELGEKYTNELVDKVIKIEAGKESNIWFGDVSSWLVGLLLENDLTFCGFTCFVNWLTAWLYDRERDPSKEDE